MKRLLFFSLFWFLVRTLLHAGSSLGLSLSFAIESPCFLQESESRAWYLNMNHFD